MNNSKLIRLLKTFSATDWEEFPLFLQSPYFVRLRKHTLARKQKLFFHIQKYIDIEAIDNPQLYKRVVWRRLFPSKPYQDVKMRQEMAILLQIVEQYIVIKERMKQEMQNKLLLLEYYERLPLLHNDFLGILNDVKNNLEVMTLKNYDWYYDCFILERIKSRYYSNITHNNIDADLLKCIHQLDMYYFFTKLEYACLIKNHPKLKHNKLPFLQPLTDYLNQTPFLYKKAPEIKIYATALALLNDEEVNFSLNQYLHLLQQHIQYFGLVDQKALYQYGLNYVIRKMNSETNTQKRNTYRIQLYHFYKEIGLKKGVIYVHNKIGLSDIRNIINLILNIEENSDGFSKKWKEQEIEQLLSFHKNKIYGDFANDAYQFNYALLLFLQKKYTLCLTVLYDITPPPILVYTLGRRRKIIKCLYELNNIDDLDRELNSFKQALRRKSVERVTVSDRAQTRHLHFIRILNKIKHTSTLKNKSRIEKIKLEIEKINKIPDKKWLLEKLMEQA